MPFEDTKKSGFNQNQKFGKTPFIIYADLECMIEKIDGCKNTPENSSTTKVNEHIQSRFSMSTIYSFRSIENKFDVHREKGCMKKFCKFLTNDTLKIIKFSCFYHIILFCCTEKYYAKFYALLYYKNFK